MLKRLRKEDFVFLIFTILYKVVLRVIFAQVVFPIYFSTSLVLENNLGFEIIGWILTISGACWISLELRKRDMSSNIMALLFFMAFIPSMMLAGMVKTDFFFLLILYYGILVTAYKLIPDFHFKRPHVNIMNALMDSIVVISSVSIIYVWIVYSGCRLSLSVDEIYVARASAAVSGMPTLLLYLYAIEKSVLPMVILYYLYNKKYVIAIWIGVLQYLVYVFEGSKTTIVSLALSIMLYIIFLHFKKAEKWYPEFFAGGGYNWLVRICNNT